MGDLVNGLIELVTGIFHAIDIGVLRYLYGKVMTGKYRFVYHPLQSCMNLIRNSVIFI